MRFRAPSTTQAFMALLLAGTLVVAACSSDDSATDPTVPTETETSDDAGGGPEVEGSVGDDLLIVPRDYLQGDWCDSDGASWSIAGDTATLDDGSGGTAQLPVDLVFIDSPDTTLVSQSDDEFVFSANGDEVTFTRGSC